MEKEEKHQIKNYYISQEELIYEDSSLLERVDFRNLDGYYHFLCRAWGLEEQPEVFSQQRLNLIRNAMDQGKEQWFQMFLLQKIALEKISHRKIVHKICQKYSLNNVKVKLNLTNTNLKNYQLEYDETCRLVSQCPLRIKVKFQYGFMVDELLKEFPKMRVFNNNPRITIKQAIY